METRPKRSVPSVDQHVMPNNSLAESAVSLNEIEKETDEILAALQMHDRKSLRRSLVRYHRRRERIIPQLLAALFEP